MKQVGRVRATAQTASGLSLIKLEGFMGLGDIEAMLCRASDIVERTGSPAVVTDYSEAFIGVCHEAMASSVRAMIDAAPDSALRAPIAIVAAPEQLRLVQDCARRMREHGISRAAFTSIDDAQQWAAEQASLRAAQMAHRWIARLRTPR